MDIPQVLEVLRPTADWGPCANTHNTYDELAAKWRDQNFICPTLAEMEAVWADLQTDAKKVKAKRDRTKARLADAAARPDELAVVMALALAAASNAKPKDRAELLAAAQAVVDAGGID